MPYNRVPIICIKNSRLKLYLLIMIVIVIYSLEFFTSALIDGLSQEFEWEQVSLSLQDSSQYSDRPQ